MTHIISYLWTVLRSIKKRTLSIICALRKQWIIFASKYLKLIYYPFFYFYQKKGVVFAINSADGVGHIFPELDHLFRILYLKKIPTKKCIVILYPSHLSSSMSLFYKDHFYSIICTQVKFALMLPIPLLFPSIAIDIGHSRLKWYSTNLKERKLRKVVFSGAISQLIHTKDGIKQYNKYYRARQQTQNLFFLKQASHPRVQSIREVLQINEKTKIALVQIKQNIANATAKITDPKTYIKALIHLKNQGYTLVFVGRERMPEEFLCLEMIDYANSIHASFANDIALFHQASLALLSGSGLSYLADCLEVPFLYLNSWHIANVPYSSYSLCVPSLIKNSRTNRILSFERQIALFEKSSKESDELDIQLYEAINADSNDIYSALVELIEKRRVLSTSQKEFISQFSKAGFMKYSQSLISQSFLKKNLHLLNRIEESTDKKRNTQDGTSLSV